ncbi:MAG: hypothetical protein LBT04_01855 [Prevotellaceae bacterium]|nr:hypothetical protein [Prevotellaceae bacterium]
MATEIILINIGYKRHFGLTALKNTFVHSTQRLRDWAGIIIGLSALNRANDLYIHQQTIIKMIFNP